MNCNAALTVFLITVMAVLVLFTSQSPAPSVYHAQENNQRMRTDISMIYLVSTFLLGEISFQDITIFKFHIFLCALRFCA